jgi:nitroreductase
MSQQRSNADVDIVPLLAERWSPRAFEAGRPVAEASLRACLEAARWAPSCFGDEPWRFIVCDRTTQPEAWQRLLDCLTSRNQRWAQNAPVLMLLSAATHFRNGKVNRWGQYDTGQAAMSLCVQAQALGLATHQMGGFDSDAVRRAFGIPDAFTPMAALALGYRADADILDEDFRDKETAPRQRQPLESTFYFGHWPASQD